MTGTTLATCLVAVLAAPQAQAAPVRGPRGELERVAAALDAAVRQVSLPSVEPLFGTEPARGYYVAGVGAVFVVPPRSMPRPARVRLLRPGRRALDLTALDAADFAEFEELLSAAATRELAEQQRRQYAAQPHTAGSVQPSADELRELEERAVAFQREAETARREIELLFEQIVRHAQVRGGRAFPSVAGGAPETATHVAGATPDAAGDTGTTVPGTHADPAAPGTPGPPPRASNPPPPWQLWSSTVGTADARTPERVVSDVRAAVTATLEAHGAELRSLGPDELISVAVDFVPRGLFSSTAPRPARTLVVRVHKKVLDERASGRLTRDAFQRAVEVSEY